MGKILHLLKYSLHWVLRLWIYRLFLDLATARALTDLCQYINSDLVFSDIKFRPLYSERATVEVVIPSGLEQKLLLATTWLLYQVEILLI